MILLALYAANRRYHGSSRDDGHGHSTALRFELSWRTPWWCWWLADFWESTIASSRPYLVCQLAPCSRARSPSSRTGMMIATRRFGYRGSSADPGYRTFMRLPAWCFARGATIGDAAGFTEYNLPSSAKNNRRFIICARQNMTPRRYTYFYMRRASRRYQAHILLLMPAMSMCHARDAAAAFISFLPAI